MWSYLTCAPPAALASCSRLRLSSTGPCPATPQVTWPTTVSSLLTPADARVRQLCSADTRTLAVSEMRSSFGDRTFAAAGSQVWNSLPPNLRLCDCHTTSSGGYWRHFYSDSEATVQCELFLTVPNRNILTYLLTFSYYEIFNTKVNTNRVEELSDGSRRHDSSWAQLVGSQRTQIHDCPHTNKWQSGIKTVLKPVTQSYLHYFMIT